MEESILQENFLDSSNLFQTLFYTWSISLCKIFKSKKASISNIFPAPKSLNYSKDLMKIIQIIQTSKNTKNIKLLHIFWKVLRSEYIYSVIPGLLSNILFICTSILVYFILSGLKYRIYSTSELILMAVLYGIIVQATFTLRNYSVYKTYLLITKIKGILIEITFQKILKLDLVELKGGNDIGKILNLVNSDVETIPGLQNLPSLFSIPFVLVICFVFLYKLLGISSLVGILTILLHLPISYLIGKFIAKITHKTVLISDERLNLIADLLEGIKVIKLYGWESHYLDKIIQSRSKELHFIKKESYIRILSNTLNKGSIGLVLLLTFLTYTLTGNELHPASAFSAISALTICNFIITGKGIQGLIFCLLIKVTFERFSSFISLSEKPKNFIIEHADYSIKLKNSIFSYKANYSTENVLTLAQDSNQESFKFGDFTQSILPITNFFQLMNIHFSATKGEFVVITGKTGSGKSSLLLAFLQELNQYAGKFYLKGSIAYTPQRPWMIEGSVRSNILMNIPMDKELYDKVIKVCALDNDLCQDSLNLLDHINVGSRGNKVSGGQMARIALARALYQNRDIYLLDDPFSAIDKPLQIKLFRSCVEFMLAEKTVVMATNNPSILEMADKILELDKGIQIFYGSYSEFVKCRSDGFRSVTFRQRKSLRKLTERPALKINSFNESQNEKYSEVGTKESKVSSYKSFTKYLVLGYKNWIGVMLIIGVIFLTQSINFALVWWVKVLVLSSSLDNLKIFVGLVASYYCFLFFRGLIINFPLINSSQNLHNSAIMNMVFCSFNVIEKLGVEQIETRFSKDIEFIDQGTRGQFEEFVSTTATFIGAVVVTCYIFPYQIIISLLVLAYIFWVFRYFMVVLSDLRKLDFEMRPLVVSDIDKVLSGITSIRCYDLQEYFESKFKSKVNMQMSTYLTSKLMYTSLYSHLEIGPNILSLISMIFFILFSNSIDPDLAAVGITYNISMLIIINSIFKCFIEFDNSLISIDSMFQYKDQLPESTEGTIQPINSGLIQFKNVYLRYSERLDYALKDLNLTFPSCSKTAIVGRSPAGKSSIFNILLRILRPVEGQILIDGIDLASFDLNYLRRIVVAIPQEPVVFSASLRMNLDPLGRVDDATLKKLMSEFGLRYLLDAVDEDLDKNLGEADLSLSAGQKQIFALLRAAVNKGKVLVVDEATANIDQSLARFVDDKINEYFYDSTVIVIAHKLTCVVNCENVVYMEEGRAVEIGNVKKLIQMKESRFQRLIEMMGDEEKCEFYEYMKLRE